MTPPIPRPFDARDSSRAAPLGSASLLLLAEAETISRGRPVAAVESVRTNTRVRPCSGTRVSRSCSSTPASETAQARPSNRHLLSCPPRPSSLLAGRLPPNSREILPGSGKPVVLSSHCDEPSGRSKRRLGKSRTSWSGTAQRHALPAHTKAVRRRRRMSPDEGLGIRRAASKITYRTAPVRQALAAKPSRNRRRRSAASSKPE